MQDPTRLILLYFILPLWLVAGFVDWICHRASHIERTTGAKESLIHLLMFGEVGLPLLAGIFLEINALVLLLMIVFFFIHEATALWDVNYAVTARRVVPIEQHVHSFLEMIPLMAILSVASIHWPQFLAIFGQGDEPARFTLQMKADPLPLGYITSIFIAIAVFEFLPYIEELWRGLRFNDWNIVPAKARQAEKSHSNTL
ncbi:MAG: diguanylate cyclase [Pseudomonas sp.]|nr:MAG: diguanylate cyclase [Pseudomonas sp.]